MARMIPDQTFYPSPGMAMSAPPETFAYVAMLNPRGGSDALGVLDVDGSSKSYSRQIHQLDMPKSGDELHHFGWNACSSCLCPFASHPHMERRFLVVPGLRCRDSLIAALAAELWTPGGAGDGLALARSVRRIDHDVEMEGADHDNDGLVRSDHAMRRLVVTAPIRPRSGAR